MQVAAGIIGEPPTKSKPAFQYTVSTQGRLITPENLAISSSRWPAARRLKYARSSDVARVELGAETYSQHFEVNSVPAAGIAVYPTPPGPMRSTWPSAVRQRMEELKGRFPQGLVYDVPFDTTKFVSAAISEVYWTLAEAGSSCCS